MEPTLWEKVSDVAEKIGIAGTVLCGALPGGRFQMGTQTVRGIDMRCFTNLPDAFYDYAKVWLRQHAASTWLMYEGEKYTFGDVSFLPLLFRGRSETPDLRIGRWSPGATHCRSHTDHSTVTPGG